MSRKQELENAKNHYEFCAKTLYAHSKIWDEQWNQQQNPFLRWKWYVSKQQKSVRKPIIDAWIDARKQFEIIKKKVKS